MVQVVVWGRGSRPITNTSYVTNIVEAWFRNRRDMLCKWHYSSKMTPRLRAESTVESMTLLSRWMLRLPSLESCCGRPKMRNSVLEGLRDRKLGNILLATLVIVCSRWVMLWEKSRAENDKRSWVASALSWWFEELDMTVYCEEECIRWRVEDQGRIFEEFHERS